MKRIEIGSASTTTPQWPGHSHRRASQPTSSWEGIEPPTVGDPLARETRLEDSSWADVRSADELTDVLFRVAHPVIVAFEDRDCTHCRAQRAMLSLAWHQLAWQVTTLRLDSRRLPHVSDHYRILGHPTLLVFSNGQVVDRLPGRRDARSIIERLSRLPGLTCTGEIRGDRAVIRPTEASTDASRAAK